MLHRKRDARPSARPSGGNLLRTTSVSIMIAIVASFVSLAPSASAATCQYAYVGGACVYDDTFSYGDDCQYDGVRQHVSGVAVFTIAGGAYVVGYNYCDTWIPACYEYEETAIVAGAYAPLVFAQVAWYEYDFASQCWGNFSGCSTSVFAYAAITWVFHDAGCPAGSPPNPGWGSLLP